AREACGTTALSDYRLAGQASPRFHRQEKDHVQQRASRRGERRVMSRTVNRETIEHVKRWEGLRLSAYPDPGSRNGEPWTIGYGHTSDGHLKVYRGLTITPAQAEEALAYDLN